MEVHLWWKTVLFLSAEELQAEYYFVVCAQFAKPEEEKPIGRRGISGHKRAWKNIEKANLYKYPLNRK